MPKPRGYRPINTLGSHGAERNVGSYSGFVRKQRIGLSQGHTMDNVLGERQLSALPDKTTKKRIRGEAWNTQTKSFDLENSEIEGSANEEDILNQHDYSNNRQFRGNLPQSSTTEKRFQSSTKSQPLVERKVSPRGQREEYGFSKEYNQVEATIESKSYAKRQIFQRSAKRLKPSKDDSPPENISGIDSNGWPSLGTNELESPPEAYSGEAGLDRSLRFPPYASWQNDMSNQKAVFIKNAHPPAIRRPLSDVEILITRPSRESGRDLRHDLRTRTRANKAPKQEARNAGASPASISSTEDVLSASKSVKPLFQANDDHKSRKMITHANSGNPNANLSDGIRLCYFSNGISRIKEDDLSLNIGTNGKTLELCVDGEKTATVVGIDKILKVLCSTAENCYKLRLHLSKNCSENGMDSNLVDIECVDRTSFQTLCEELKNRVSINWGRHPTDRIENLFQYREKKSSNGQVSRENVGRDLALDVQLIQFKKRVGDSSAPSEDSAPKAVPPASRKLTKRLRTDPEMEDRAIAPHNVETKGFLGNERLRRAGRSSGLNQDIRVTMTQEEDRYQTNDSLSDLSAATIQMARVPYSENPGLGPRWKRPLVYPRSGKGGVTVDFEDLLRLDEGEFLNDNLIEFYLKRSACDLEKNNPVAAKKVYWFNTYFYESLNKTGRGKKGINFESVKKWTRSVDIFSYDYIVVPINEAAHWYVAIICNLPALEETVRAPAVTTYAGSSVNPIGLDGTQDIEEGIIGSGETPSNSTHHENNRIETSEDTRTRESFSDLHLDEKQSDLLIEIMEETLVSENEMLDEPNTGPPEDKRTSEPLDNSVEENYNSTMLEVRRDSKLLVSDTEATAALGSPQGQGDVDTEEAAGMSSQKVHNKKRRVSARIYNPHEPAIITLDSLGLTHSATTRALKSYLLEEAHDKRGIIHFTDKQIKGMTATGIPLQDNYCDCGLYLLGYVDKFTEDPEQFVSKILQREFDQTRDWPALRPSDMRAAVRQLIMELHGQQEAENRFKRRSLQRVSHQLNHRAPINLRGKAINTPKKDSIPTLPQEEADTVNKASKLPGSRILCDSTVPATDMSQFVEELKSHVDVSSQPTEMIFKPIEKCITLTDAMQPKSMKEVALIVPNSQESDQPASTSKTDDKIAQETVNVGALPTVNGLSAIDEAEMLGQLDSEGAKSIKMSGKGEGTQKKSREIISIDDS